VRYYCSTARASSVDQACILAATPASAAETHASHVPIEEWTVNDDGASIRIIVKADDEYTPRVFEVVREFRWAEVSPVDSHTSERILRGEL
jgi:hypothetical protein